MVALLATSGVAGFASTAATTGPDGVQAFERTQADGNVSVTFQNQTTNGTAVTVESVTLPEGGFVQITNEIGVPVGQSDYLEPGVYQEVTVTLDENLTANQSLTAFVIRDANDNQQFDETGPGNGTDAVYTTATGDAAADQAFVRLVEPRQPGPTGNVTNVTARNRTNVTADNVTVDNETNVTAGNRTNVTRNVTNATASLAFEDQTSNGTTVVVERAVLPRGGFVVVHTAAILEGAEADSVRGVSEYLAPGTHRNVTVRLDRPMTDARRLVVVSYRDTNGDRTFEFYDRNRSVDAPYLRNGNVAVADDAVVTVRAANATAGGNATVGGNATAGGGNATA